MQAIYSICRRDVFAAFSTPLAWLLLACWSLLTNGVFIFKLHSVHGRAEDHVPLFVTSLSFGVFFLGLLAPAVTMVSFASERAQGTMQLLLTAPIRESELIVGKFLASFVVLSTLVAATLIQPAILYFISQVNVPHLLAGYLGLILECAFFAALGNWISLLVDSPVAAYVLTFAAIALLLLVGVAGEENWMHYVGDAIGLGNRAGPFFDGQIRLGGIMYFLAGTAASLIMAHSALCARRLHG